MPETGTSLLYSAYFFFNLFGRTTTSTKNRFRKKKRFSRLQNSADSHFTFPLNFKGLKNMYADQAKEKVWFLSAEAVLHSRAPGGLCRKPRPCSPKPRVPDSSPLSNLKASSCSDTFVFFSSSECFLLSACSQILRASLCAPK